MIVEFGATCPLPIPRRQVLQFHVEDRSLHRIDAVVVADDVVHVLRLAPVVSELAKTLRQLRVARRDRAGIPERAEVLAGVEAEASDVAIAAGA